MNLIWTVVAAVAASISALFAAIYTLLTYRIVRSQGEPKVVVYVCGDPDRQTVILIRIANIGRDVATDIRFTASRAIPARAYGISLDEAKPAEIMSDGPLIDGIPILGPGDTRDTTWGQFGGLMKALGKEPIDIKITYKHGRRKMRGYSRLEVASFIGTDASENPNVVAAQSLEKIAKSTEVLAQAARRRQKPQTPDQMKQALMMAAAATGTPVTVRSRPKPDETSGDQS